MSVATTPTTSDLTRRVGRLFGLLSTYPPTPCGLATFSAALGRGLEANGAAVGVVRLADGATSSDPRVLSEMDNGVPASLAKASATLNGCDVAIVQHDYGLYGGADGEEVIGILHRLTIPSIVVAHTVLLEPTDHQRKVLGSDRKRGQRRRGHGDDRSAAVVHPFRRRPVKSDDDPPRCRHPAACNAPRTVGAGRCCSLGAYSAPARASNPP